MNTGADRTAKRLAHGWARAIRSRQTSASAKLLAWAFADYSTAVTAELAHDLGLGPEYVGTLAAWPSVRTLAGEIGLADERTTRRQLAALGGDLVVHERRHLRLPSVYVLAVEGVPVRVGDAGDRGDRPGRTEERPGRSRTSDRGECPGPIKEEPIRDPNKEPRAGSARADACAGTSADARVCEAAAAAAAAWERVSGEALGPSAGLEELAGACVAQADRYGGELAEIAAAAVVGFFLQRPDLTRPRPEWVCERFGRYLMRGRRERKREAAESERAATEWWQRPDRELPHDPPPASPREAIERAAERSRIELPVQRAARSKAAS